MAPLSKDQLVDLIKEKIEPNGNTRAIEVRKVLNELLDYATHEPDDNDLKPFHFNNNRQPVEDRRRAVLLYSFMGIEKHSVNFTFKFNATTGNNGSLSFKLEPELIKVLEEIVQTQGIDFIVPLRRHVSDNNEVVVGVGLNLIIKDPVLHMEFSNFEIKSGDNIFTSVQFHVPKSFNLG